MKLILALVLTLLTVQAHAESVASDGDQGMIDQNQYGKLDAAAREMFARQMQDDIDAMGVLQERFDSLGVGAWVSRLGQDTYVAESKMNLTTGIDSDVAFSYEAAQRAQIEVAQMRSQAQAAYDKCSKRKMCN